MFNHSTSSLTRLLNNGTRYGSQSLRRRGRKQDERRSLESSTRESTLQQKRWHSLSVSTDGSAKDEAVAHESKTSNAPYTNRSPDKMLVYVQLDDALNEAKLSTSSRMNSGRDTELLSFDYAGRLPDALLSGDAELVTRCIQAAEHAQDLTFVQSMSDQDFSTAISLVCQAESISRLINIHEYIKNASVHAYGLMPLEDIAQARAELVMSLLTLRVRSGAHLVLGDYEIVLTTMKTLRTGAVASAIWQMLQSSGIRPSVKCFNGYVGSILYNTPVGARTRQRDRVVPTMLTRRRSQPLKWYLSFAVEDGGPMSKSDPLFMHMQELGIEPDTESYCNMIRACSLEGKVDAVTSVLRNVWGIDIDALLGDDEPAAPNQFEDGHPLMPNKMLMYEATRAFCINNDLKTALRLMEHLCQSYQLQADQKQWTLIMEWTHVLSKDRGEKAEWNGLAAGRVGLGLMQTLWQRMTSAPYNIAPHIGMYDLLIRNLRWQHNDREARDDMLNAMEDGREKYTIQKQRRGIARGALFDAVAQGETSQKRGQMPFVEHKAKMYELECLQCIRDREFVQSWLHHYLQGAEMFAETDFDARLTAVVIPSLLERWHNDVPRTVEYAIPTGLVELQVRTAEQSERFQKTRRRLNKAEVLGRECMLDGFTTAERSVEHAFDTGFAHTKSTTIAGHAKGKQFAGLRRPGHLRRDQSEGLVRYTQ